MAQEVSREPVTVTRRPPTTLWSYLRNLGPGIVIGMLWLGTGDLVDSSVSGGNYQYALMWTVVIAIIARFFATSALAKYHLCNSRGDATILHGYARVWRGFPLFLASAGVLLGFGYNTYLLKGSAIALYHLSGQPGGSAWGVFGWAVIIVGITVFMATRRNQYKGFEWAATASVIVLIGVFFIALGFTGIAPVAAAKGLAFGLPSTVGPFGALLLVASLIGGVGGSANNLLYTYFLKEKGWHGPAYRRQQIYDLLAGAVAIIVIDLAVWMVAAEALKGTHLVISSVDDLATMMKRILGPAGAVLLWIGLLGAAYDGYPSASHGYAAMFVGAVHQTFPRRAERFKETGTDPVFRWVQFGMLIVPIIFSLPFAPSFIFMTVLINALAVILVPPIIVGLLWMTNKKAWLLPGWTNSWWENAILCAVGGVGMWATYNLIRSLLGT